MLCTDSKKKHRYLDGKKKKSLRVVENHLITMTVVMTSVILKD